VTEKKKRKETEFFKGEGEVEHNKACEKNGGEDISTKREKNGGVCRVFVRGGPGDFGAEGAIMWDLQLRKSLKAVKKKKKKKKRQNQRILQGKKSGIPGEKVGATLYRWQRGPQKYDKAKNKTSGGNENEGGKDWGGLPANEDRKVN